MEFSFKNLYKYLKDYDIIEAYVGLLKNNIIDISEEKIIKLLSIAALLIEREELEYQKLAYYIILKYSILTEDYTPLYDISYKLFNIPVIELLDKINNCRFVKHMSHFLDTTNVEIPIMLLLNFHFLYILHIYRLD